MAIAFGAAERLRVYTVTWALAGLVLALALGYLLARRLTRPIHKLSRAPALVAAGDYGAPADVGPGGADELGDLGRAFGSMTAEIRRRDEEIRAWNAELQKRVDERTAELKAAQDQILRTRRLAALGSLGAGLAHELNNPMTAITGYLAILRKQVSPESPQADMIARAQEQAGRVARVVEDEQQPVRYALGLPRRDAVHEGAQQVHGSPQAEEPERRPRQPGPAEQERHAGQRRGAHVPERGGERPVAVEPRADHARGDEGQA